MTRHEADFPLIVIEALDTIRNAARGSLDALAHLNERMDRLKIKIPQRSPASRQNGKVESINTPRLEQAQRSAFTPASRAIFARPYPSLSGLRAVPHLISANGFPFLRYNRPQPPSASRVINDRIIAFQHRVDRLHDYQDTISMGKAEDAWEESLKRYCGLERLQGPSWSQAPTDALDDVIKIAKRQTWRTKTMALDMYRIMEGERALAEKEKIARRDDRHRRYKARRHARYEGIEGGDYEENVLATMSGG